MRCQNMLSSAVVGDFRYACVVVTAQIVSIAYLLSVIDKHQLPISMLEWLRATRISASLAASRSATALTNTLTMAHVRNPLLKGGSLSGAATTTSSSGETAGSLSPAVVDFRSRAAAQSALAALHTRNFGDDGSSGVNLRGWNLMCDKDVGGRSVASLALRTRRSEDDVLRMAAKLGGTEQEQQKDQGEQERVEGDDDLGALVFSGVLSLETSGKMIRSGYAAIESPRFAPMLDLSDCDRLQMRVRSCGGLYVANIRTPSPIIHNLYQHPFATPAGEWTTVELPFSGFLATVRGRIDPIQRPFDEDAIQNIGFLMAQRSAGPFRLEVQWIRAINSNQHILESRYTADSYSAATYQAWRDEMRER